LEFNNSSAKLKFFIYFETRNQFYFLKLIWFARHVGWVDERFAYCKIEEEQNFTQNDVTFDEFSNISIEEKKLSFMLLKYLNAKFKLQNFKDFLFISQPIESDRENIFFKVAFILYPCSNCWGLEILRL